MVELRRILCPIDFSDTSRHAVEHAAVIAKWYGSRITGLFSYVLPALAYPSPEFGGSASPVGLIEADLAALDVKLREFLKPADDSGVPTDAVIGTGEPALQILERAKALPADLIVMGTHGRAGFERLVLGSVTEKVLRKTTCPVLTVPPPTSATAKLPFKRLLCPVDFSDASLAALRFAFSLAQESAAHLTILHVVEWGADFEPIVSRSFDVAEYERLLAEDAGRRLAAIIPDEVRSWCEPATLLRVGKPYREILAVASAERADLIVMGVHGRNAVDLMLFGSTTNQVVRRAGCPVLTLRP